LALVLIMAHFIQRPPARTESGRGAGAARPFVRPPKAAGGPRAVLQGGEGASAAGAFSPSGAAAGSSLGVRFVRVSDMQLFGGRRPLSVRAENVHYV